MERLRYQILKSDKSQKEIAAEVGISQSSLSQYCTGYRQPDHATLIKLADYFNVSVDYLLGRDYDDTDFYQYDGVEPIRRTGRTVPHLGEIACGVPILAEQNYDREDELPDGVHADFTLTARGDSMIGAMIRDGDTIFVRRQPMVEEGEIAAVLIGTDATLKRVHRVGRTLILLAENAKYPPIVVDMDDGGDVTIMGKAVYFLSKIR